ncbi:MAG: PAS domain-containing sensor histidine kinase, partial [Ginsengibacter sp.]
GMNAWGNVHDTEKDMLEKIFITLLQAPGATQTILHQFRDKNNTWQWIENTITNLTDHSAINGFVSNFRNVTDRILLERQKDDFVGVATHELKTPVTSIKAYTQILHNRFKREGNDNAAALLQKMDVQLDKLIGLIGDMLDVTKIEAGRLQYQENFYDLDSMVHEVIEELQRTTDHHDIEVKMDGKPKIFGDRERISQVLSNLISNAIKYSPNCRTILVTSNCCKDSVKLCVHDYGFGILEENQLKIFERFYRVSGPDNNTFPGIGLGLYISHEIVKKQGGRLWVESKKGEGSVFCCELPYDYRTTNTKHFQSK